MAGHDPVDVEFPNVHSEPGARPSIDFTGFQAPHHLNLDGQTPTTKGSTPRS